MAAHVGGRALGRPLPLAPGDGEYAGNQPEVAIEYWRNYGVKTAYLMLRLSGVVRDIVCVSDAEKRC